MWSHDESRHDMRTRCRRSRRGWARSALRQAGRQHVSEKLAIARSRARSPDFLSNANNPRCVTQLRHPSLLHPWACEPANRRAEPDELPSLMSFSVLFYSFGDSKRAEE